MEGMEGVGDRAAGKAKEVAGVVTNDRSLEAKGKLQQGKGHVRGWFRRRRERKAARGHEADTLDGPAGRF